ncbi:DUF4397 domain-containing protein [Marixanthomonas spongiae]|uniref:DUF4397 domain-containing protein n=1 Tax=Marixanthomonas spongiae TaxID=2174845 RepID=A0A2U0I236_9FLAO|nr:DUF4397 domain-containing protein [Marixanthomonas spongiae]PVW15169.1 hypothetical protein DDV96_07105 [Marixanthomonas spongiae]
MKKQLLLFIFTVFTIFGCAVPKEPASLRIGQFLVSEKAVEITFQHQGNKAVSKIMTYGDLTEYMTLTPGKYTVTVKINETVILEKKLGFGSKGTYTLFVCGIPSEKGKTNQTTLNNKLHNIVAGEEGITTNGNLPQLRVLNDTFESKDTEAKIRWIHAVPGLQPLSATLWNKKTNTKTSLATLSYPLASKSKGVSSGAYSLTWKLKGKQLTTVSKNVVCKPKHLYTFFVIGKRNDFVNELQVVQGVSEK